MEYVDLHGKITRSTAAELCGLEGREARGVLEKLVRRRELVVRGEKRGAYYEKAGAAVAEQLGEAGSAEGRVMKWRSKF